LNLIKSIHGQFFVIVTIGAMPLLLSRITLLFLPRGRIDIWSYMRQYIKTHVLSGSAEQQQEESDGQESKECHCHRSEIEEIDQRQKETEHEAGGENQTRGAGVSQPSGVRPGDLKANAMG
jgi:hypothetical protein